MKLTNKNQLKLIKSAACKLSRLIKMDEKFNKIKVLILIY
jgi:hypothetical protein